MSSLLQLIDKHLNYWRGRNARKTTQRLHDAKTCVLGLLTALRSPSNRLALTCTAIYRRDIKSLVLAIYSPRIVREGDVKGIALKAEAYEDRNKFKTYFHEVVMGLRDLCKSEIDGAMLQKFVDAPKESIEKWLGEQADALETIDAGVDIENPYGIVLAEIQPEVPAGMYA